MTPVRSHGSTVLSPPLPFGEDAVDVERTLRRRRTAATVAVGPRDLGIERHDPLAHLLHASEPPHLRKRAIDPRANLEGGGQDGEPFPHEQLLDPPERVVAGVDVAYRHASTLEVLEGSVGLRLLNLHLDPRLPALSRRLALGHRMVLAGREPARGVSVTARS